MTYRVYDRPNPDGTKRRLYEGTDKALAWMTAKNAPGASVTSDATGTEVQVWPKGGGR